ncbi:MAG TPA: biotin-dependent carboxyltransferase family protein [Cyclobacteriaceae bacterium]|nr:biotin-dependent carboxyltransferase family protein [Cyclobacteriaceae bacterium]
MSVEVIKAGIADTFQDGGRFGHQHLGINPGGAMDLNTMQVVNALVGNELNEAVLELCFPASVLYFKKSALIALSGANFSAELNGKSIPINQSITVSAGSELKFTKVEKGVFCYLAIHGGFSLSPWLNSCSTNTKAKAGGLKGRSLQRGDLIEFKKNISAVQEVKILPWRANVFDFYSNSTNIQFLRGPEFNWLDESSKERLMKESFAITSLRDRMGYRLKGRELNRKNEELISTTATFGTVQLLPDGQLIILMADHQTTGGYPRIAQVIAADRSKLVQTSVGEDIFFCEVSLQEAEDLLLVQRKILKQIQVTCQVRLKDFFNSAG